MPEAKLWIWGGTALVPGAPNGRLEDAAIGIADGKIVSIGKRSEVTPAPGARKIDTTGCLVTPGFVNGHTHTGMSLLRGLADDLPLDTWLREVIFPTEQKWGSPDFVYWGTLLACAEMIRGGITTFNDMYYFEERAAQAANEAGMRMVAGQSLTEESDIDGTGKDLTGSFDRFRESVGDFPLVTASVAPHAIYSVSRENWKALIEYSAKTQTRIHFHLCETRWEVQDCQKKYGKTPVAFFEELGLWEQPVTAAHAVCLTPEDIQILGKHRVGISHNPESNFKLATEIAPVVELRRAGARVALGTDSTASNNNLDLFGEADVAAKMQAFKYGAGALKAQDVFSMLTREGALALGLEETGVLEVGKQADIIAIDVTAPHAVPIYNPYSHIVYGAGARDVKHSVVNGQVLMENRTLLTLDEQEIVREAAHWARRISP
ncbi:amidohydrolase [bacterium]|nr:amidohydrolase [bacterium]